MRESTNLSCMRVYGNVGSYIFLSRKLQGL
nr:MAG TPA: hypothetical protein [Caudoviricetes sp.]